MSEIKHIETVEFPEHARVLMDAVYDSLNGQSVETAINILMNIAVNVVAETSGDMDALKLFLSDLVDAHAAARRNAGSRG